MTVNRARQQAKFSLKVIKELIEEYKSLEGSNNRRKEEKLMEIESYPLEISIREGWHAPGYESTTRQYRILLCTGGPAVRIVGDLNEYKEPQSAEIQYQDWEVPWTELPLAAEDERILIQFASKFYYG